MTLKKAHYLQVPSAFFLIPYSLSPKYPKCPKWKGDLGLGACADRQHSCRPPLAIHPSHPVDGRRAALSNVERLYPTSTTYFGHFGHFGPFRIRPVYTPPSLFSTSLSILNSNIIIIIIIIQRRRRICRRRRIRHISFRIRHHVCNEVVEDR